MKYYLMMSSKPRFPYHPSFLSYKKIKISLTKKYMSCFYIMSPKLFRKIAGGATKFFSKVAQNAPAILNKVSDISGQIGKGLGQGAPIVGSIGLATGQPELIGLSGAMKAGAIGANQLSKTSGQLSTAVDKNSDPLQRARIGAQVGKQIIYG